MPMLGRPPTPAGNLRSFRFVPAPLSPIQCCVRPTGMSRQFKRMTQAALRSPQHWTRGMGERVTRGGGQRRSAGEVDPSSFYSGGFSEATIWRLLLHGEVRPKVNLSQKTNVFTVMQTSLNFSCNQTKQNPSVTPLWATTIKLKFAVGRVASGKGWRLRRRGAGGFHGMEFWCMLTRASVRVCAQERAGACVRA